MTNTIAILLITIFFYIYASIFDLSCSHFIVYHPFLNFLISHNYNWIVGEVGNNRMGWLVSKRMYINHRYDRISPLLRPCLLHQHVRSFLDLDLAITFITCHNILCYPLGFCVRADHYWSMLMDSLCTWGIHRSDLRVTTNGLLGTSFKAQETSEEVW